MSIFVLGLGGGGGWGGQHVTQTCGVLRYISLGHNYHDAAGFILRVNFMSDV